LPETENHTPGLHVSQNLAAGVSFGTGTFSRKQQAKKNQQPHEIFLGELGTPLGPVVIYLRNPFSYFDLHDIGVGHAKITEIHMDGKGANRDLVLSGGPAGGIIVMRGFGTFQCQQGRMDGLDIS
jgi:hypothetical protein